jgi:hypothetical protein
MVLTSSELEEVVLLQSCGEPEGVEGVLRVGRVSERLVVLVLDEQLVEALVHGGNVVL